jgi:glucose-6-phosphate isomerase
MEVNLEDRSPDIRYLKDITKVIFDKEWLKTADLNLELYYMYRGIEEKDGIRYDITVIPAQMLGKEFTKTKGHFHDKKYGEIYTVLEGEAIYLMQKEEDVYAVKAKKGDVVIIPSFYGHVTINPSENQELKMANWVSADCQSNYLPYEESQGAAYYFTKQGWIKNENYNNTPELRFEEPLKSVPENLDFLR